jgi:hypothetical protein
MGDRWLCPLCNHLLTEDAWSRLPRTMVAIECGSRTEITCPKCGRQTVGMAWVRVEWQPAQDRLVSCHRGFERIVPAPADMGEELVLVLPAEGEPLFPECHDCEEFYRDEGNILLMPDDAGTLHLVKLCLVTFRDVEAV